MKKKILAGSSLAAFAVAVALNISTGLKNNDGIDMMLNNAEALGNNESGSSHGRPLLQGTKTGAYKCANCTGSDCGAAC